MLFGKMDVFEKTLGELWHCALTQHEFIEKRSGSTALMKKRNPPQTTGLPSPVGK